MPYIPYMPENKNVSVRIPKMLPEKQRTRLIQLLGMLGSAFDGEVVNAARLAAQLLTNYKLSWAELIGPGYASTNGDLNRAGGGPEQWRAGFEAGLQKAAQMQKAALAAEYSNGFADGVKNARAMGVRPDSSWKDWARHRADSDHEWLSDWEVKFFGSFADGRYAVPSQKQRAIFERVAERLDLELPE